MKNAIFAFLFYIINIPFSGCKKGDFVISQPDSPLKVTMANGDVIYAHPIDNSTKVEWGAVGFNITALKDITTTEAANMDFNGEANTTAIAGGYAAKVCAGLVDYGFDDWYLPAAGELNEMYLKLGPNGSGQITTGIYWSSSESDENFAWGQDFGDGGRQESFLKFGEFRCRCVRR